MHTRRPVWDNKTYILGISTGLGILCLLFLAMSLAPPALATAGDPPFGLAESLPGSTLLLCPDVVAPPGVNALDIGAITARWPLTAANPDPDNDPNTPNYEPRYDIDQDGDIDVDDIRLTAEQWNAPGTPPAVEITSVPPYNVWGVPLVGRVGCVNPADYKVAVYIFVEGWWNKPTFASPLTTIQSNGTWSTNVTTGGCDQLATRFAAFLLPNGANPILLSGAPSMPSAMLVYPHVIVERMPGTRTIQFSGATWVVKSTGTCRTVGPGPNYFSDAASDVWVDGGGKLHMRIVNRNGLWWSSEVISKVPLTFGTLTYTLASRVDLLDPNVVVGLFSWDELDETYAHRELDIEFSRWGDPGAANNAQYVIQPWNVPGHRHQFPMQLQGDYSTHRMIWQSNAVQFDSYQGAQVPPPPGSLIESWLYTGADVPPAGGHARINLWLLGGQAPLNGLEVELMVDSVSFTPAANPP